MTTSPKQIDGVTYSRIPFARLAKGQLLYRMASDAGGTPMLLGRVVEVRTDAEGMTVGATLDTGTRMTARGWCSRRIWRRHEQQD